MTEPATESVMLDGPMGLTPEQQDVLLRPIQKGRVSSRDGQSYLEAWDVRAHLIRVFGFGGWSADLVDLSLIHDLQTQTRAGKEARKVAYRATMRLIIHATGATYTEAAVGESVMPDFKWGDAHDMAIKTAESQALKRCAINLGTQFGLSLYDAGSLNDVVKMLVVGKPTESKSAGTEMPDIQVTPEPVIDPDSLDPARVVDGNPYE